MHEIEEEELQMGYDELLGLVRNLRWQLQFYEWKPNERGGMNLRGGREIESDDSDINPFHEDNGVDSSEESERPRRRNFGPIVNKEGDSPLGNNEMI